MDEIEVWVRDFYDVDEEMVGEFARRFVDVDVWKEWAADDVRDWAQDEDSYVDLWEQIHRGITLLPPDADYVDFLADYRGDRFVGLYDSEKREFVVQAADGKFDIRAEMIYRHEYSHHVQNVKYDYPFFKDCFRADTDAAQAMSALIEGDAVRTEGEYIFNVLGWDNYQRLWEELEEEEQEEPAVESGLSRFFDARNDFRYGQGLVFAFGIAPIAECPECEADRSPIDEAFERPPFTTEQIYYAHKYFAGEGRDELSLPDDLVGDEWELRYGSTVGRSDWLALLAALTEAEIEEIGSEYPGWRGDYQMLFEDVNGRALNLRVAVWENNRYIESLVNAFDGLSQLKRYQPDQPTDRLEFEQQFLWRGDAGMIALGIDINSVDRFHFMFIAVGPDAVTVTEAIFVARDSLTLFGEDPFPTPAESR